MQKITPEQIRRWRELPDPARPQKALRNPLLKDYLQELEAHGRYLAQEPAKQLTYELYALYFQTGNRLLYEEAYFDRRSRLATFGLLSWLYGRGEDLSRLTQVIWEVCGEYTWSLPAHVHGALETDNYTVDLFAAETAVCLTEILHYVGGKLPEEVRLRACAEIDRRVLVHFEQATDPFPFELMKNNWCAVCAGSIGMCALYRVDEPQRLSRILNRVGDTLARFLDSFEEDGACLEGLSYWTYGVSYFTAFCELLLRKSGGTLDWTDMEKFRRIAAFQQKCYFCGGRTLSFSDADTRERYRLGLTSYLCGKYAEVSMPPAKCRASYREDSCYRWVILFRDLIWSAERMQCRPEIGMERLPQAGWWLVHDAAVGIAVKGGNNAEPHNHNDIGHFLLYQEGEELFADLGAGEYTREYFQEETRYQIFCNQSFGHSVPLIGGKGQEPGREHAAAGLRYIENGVQMDLAGAYDKGTVQKLLRTFVYQDHKLTMTDQFRFDTAPSSLAERLITRGTVLAEPGRLIFISGRQRAALIYPSQELEARIYVIAHSNHQGRTEQVTAADLFFKKISRQMECRLEIRLFVSEEEGDDNGCN